MQILTVRLKNIKSHREAEFVFSPGINVLAGPNGAGKSTVFEAIGYALFGVDARDFVGRVDRFLTLGAKRGEVEVVFSGDDGTCWRVTRTVGAGSRWLLAEKRNGSFEVEEHAGSAETEKRLLEILGLDGGRPLAEQFKLVIGPLQSDFLGPFVLRGSRRQEAFDQILGIDGWRRTFEGTLELQKGVLHRIDCLEAEIAGRAEQVAVLPARRAELKSVRAQEKEKIRGQRSLEKELAAAERRLTELDGCRQALEKADAEVRLLRERLEKGTGMVAEARTRLAEAETALGIVEQAQPGRDAFERAEAKLKELRLRERERQAAEREVHALERDCDRLRQHQGHEEREIAAAERQLRQEEEALRIRLAALPAPQVRPASAELADLRRRLEVRRGERALLQGRRDSLLEGREQLAGGSCPFLGEACGNLAAADAPFDLRLGDMEEKMATLQQEIERLQVAAAAAEQAEKAAAALVVQRQELQRQMDGLGDRQRRIAERVRGLEPLRVQREGAEAALAGKRRLLDSFAGLDSALAAAEAECERFRVDRDRHQAHAVTAGDLQPRRRTLEKYESLLADLRRQHAAMTEELEQRRSAYDSQHHEEARRQRDRLLGEVARLGEEVRGLAEYRSRLEAEIERLGQVEAEIETKKTRIASLREKEALVKFLRSQVFNQVSGRLSERFREEIGRRAALLYRTIAETDEELVWGEGYQIVLRDLQDGQIRERTDDQLSGGQMMSAVIALRLALLQTIGARLAFFDEPTSNLDADRRENLARAFRAIDLGREEATRHWYDQLFLVSHDTAFAEITDQILEF